MDHLACQAKHFRVFIQYRHPARSSPFAAAGLSDPAARPSGPAAASAGASVTTGLSLARHTVWRRWDSVWLRYDRAMPREAHGLATIGLRLVSLRQGCPSRGTRPGNDRTPSGF